MTEDMDNHLEDQEERPLTEDEVGDWEVIEPKSSTARSAVLTVRFSPEELRRIRDAAKSSRQSMADVIRDAVAAHLTGTAPIVSMGWSWSTGVGEANVLARSGLVTRGQGLQEQVGETPA